MKSTEFAYMNRVRNSILRELSKRGMSAGYGLMTSRVNIQTGPAGGLLIVVPQSEYARTRGAEARHQIRYVTKILFGGNCETEVAAADEHVTA